MPPCPRSTCPRHISTINIFFLTTGMVKIAFAQLFQINRLLTTGSLPTPRMDPALHSTGTTVILFGGLAQEGAMGDTWLYNISTNIWQQINLKEGKTRPSARYDFISAILHLGPDRPNPHLVIAGGRNSRGILKESLVWAFDVVNKAWTEVQIRPEIPSSSLRPLSRAGACGGGSKTGTLLISHGFSSDGAKSDTYEIVFESATIATLRRLYHHISPFAVGDPHPLYNASSVVTAANELVVYGGCYANGLCPSRDVWSFDILSRQWRLVGRGRRERRKAVMARTFAAFDELGVDSRQSMFVWGGETERDLTSSVLEVSVLDVRSKKWAHEKVNDHDLQLSTLFGAAIAPLKSSGMKQDYLVFGGASNKSKGVLTNAVMVLTFDAQRPRNMSNEKAEIFFSHLISHALLMAIAYGLLLPIGILGSRYVRAFSPSPKWYYWHWICQTVGILFAWIGMVFGILKEPREGSKFHVHKGFGVVLMTIVTSQAIAALPFFRPGLEAGTPRTIWRFIHLSFGWIVLLVGVINILLGMFLIVAPTTLWILWSCILSVTTFVIFPVLEILKRRQTSHIDTKYKEYVVDGTLTEAPRQGRPMDEQSSSWISGLSTLYF